MDINRKCSHFIGCFSHMMSNFSHLNPESVVTLVKSYCCSFYGSFSWKYNSDSLENAVHNGTNVFEEYIRFHITHIDGY